MRIFSIQLLSLTRFVLELMSYMFAVFYIYRFVLAHDLSQVFYLSLFLV